MGSPVQAEHAVTPAESTADTPACPLCSQRMVIRRARRGPHAGLTFWGCATFPACRGVRPLATHSPGRPGEVSARVTYERRLARHRTKVRRRRARVLLLGGSVVVGGIVLGLVGGSIHRTISFFGWAVAAATAIYTVTEIWTIPAQIRSWRAGTDGEDRTAQALSELEAEGFVVLHDRRKPGSSANINHVIVGPTGVFVVESKSYSGPLSIQGDDVYVGGRRRTDIVYEARSEAEIVEAILAIAGGHLSVTPILCIHRAELPLLKAEVQGIRVVNERGLIRVLRGTNQTLEPQTVLELAALLNRELRPTA